MMASAIAFAPGYERYVRETPGLIHPELTRSVRVNWEVRDSSLIPEGFPWKPVEGTTKETQRRGDHHAGLEMNAILNGVDIPTWATARNEFLRGNRVDSSQLLLGIVNQAFVPVKTYAQLREQSGRTRLTVVFMDVEKARDHPVAALLDTPQAEYWRHRDVRDAMRSRSVVWDNIVGFNNTVWDGNEFNPRERSLDFTFTGRQLIGDKKPRNQQIKGVVRVVDHIVDIFPD